MEIECRKLAEYVMFKLDKIKNEFMMEDLDKIDEIVLDYQEILDDNDNIDLQALTLFKNLKSLELINFDLDNKFFSHLYMMRKLKTITFDRCAFENADLIASLNVTNLRLINLNLNSYKFVYIMKNLEYLTIINGNVDLEMINQLYNLKYLQISYSYVDNFNKGINLQMLEELYIDNTNISSINIDNLTNLKILGISRNQKNNSKHQVMIKIDGVIPLGDNND